MNTATNMDKSLPSSSANKSRDLENEVNKARNDLTALKKTIGDLGKEKMDALKGMTDDLPDELMERSREAIADLRKQITVLERDLENRVREKPLAWLLGAVGVGVVLAAILRR
ncbi:YqjD family protein [Pseudoruegeria sp. SK021]|uniref:DUF883 family protein n=1 Tax=Pseudoruegeria sp. SK021 TaxID=1933035 RepID=UPI000A256A73|nr:DUF883 family protein [Pseudoruegeria sp. SK021]OSP56126.1 hypothetical protein BV911_04095 [Pseudoruegeria sp. SK021]